MVEVSKPTNNGSRIDAKWVFGTLLAILLVLGGWQANATSGIRAEVSDMGKALAGIDAHLTVVAEDQASRKGQRFNMHDYERLVKERLDHMSDRLVRLEENPPSTE